jgi:hypothetical protein
MCQDFHPLEKLPLLLAFITFKKAFLKVIQTDLSCTPIVHEAL